MTDNASFKETFKRLKQILVPYSEELVIVTDEDDNFYLNTHFTMKNKKPMYFGSVKINKNYVSYHLMPVYVFPDLRDDMSPALNKRMQGKSCFNFKTIEDVLYKELAELTKAGYSKYESAGYL